MIGIEVAAIPYWRLAISLRRSPTLPYSTGCGIHASLIESQRRVGGYPAHGDASDGLCTVGSDIRFRGRSWLLWLGRWRDTRIGSSGVLWSAFLRLQKRLRIHEFFFSKNGNAAYIYYPSTVAFGALIFTASSLRIAKQVVEPRTTMVVHETILSFTGALGSRVPHASVFAGKKPDVCRSPHPSVLLAAKK